jgi:hypothetical protein
LFLVLCLSTLAAAPSFANWSNNAAINTPLCTAAGDEFGAKAVSDGAGGAIVTWIDGRNSPTDPYNIYARRVDGFGNPLWTPDGVAVCTADSIQFLPVILADGAGGAIIAWLDKRGSTYDLYAQRLNAAGVPQWTPNGVLIAGGPGDQYANDVVSDGSGGAIFVWGDSRGANVDVYVRRVNSSGVPQWTANGVALSTAAGDQSDPHLVSDGSGGAIVCWTDYRLGVNNPDIFVRRVNSSGVPQWTADGVALCTATGKQFEARIISDGNSGAIVSWYDERLGVSNSDIFARRVDSTGAPQWTSNGSPVCTFAAASQYHPAIASDGAGGAIITWADYRSPYGVYAQRMSSAGTAVWTANGVGVCTVTQLVVGSPPQIISDGSGGAILCWNDFRVSSSECDLFSQRVNSSGTSLWTAGGIAIGNAAGSSQQDGAMVQDAVGGVIYGFEDWRTGNGDIYAQRVDGTGTLGISEPIIDDVRDVPNDQGGKVEVLWQASSFDVAPANPVESYTLWRRIITTTAAQRAGATRMGRGSPPTLGSVRVTGNGPQSLYWEFIVTFPARGFPGYAYMVDTGSDSLPGSVPWNVFMVEAKKGSVFYQSRVDSGYSVDNLSPATPGPFTGGYSGGATHLHWNRSGESDLYGYRLYRGGSADFDPSPGTLISAQSDTGYTDPAAGYYYKLSAVDVHGNESGFALLTPGQTTDARSGGAVASLMLSAENPARRLALVRYAIPGSGFTRITVHDVMGREVKVLTSEIRAPGEYTLRWDGRTEAGEQARTGVYLIRLTASAGTRTVRCVLLR